MGTREGKRKEKGTIIIRGLTAWKRGLNATKKRS